MQLLKFNTKNINLIILLFSCILLTNCGTTDSDEKKSTPSINGSWRYLEPGNDFYVKISLEDSLYNDYEEDPKGDCFFVAKNKIKKLNEEYIYEVSDLDGEHSTKALFRITNDELVTDIYNEDYHYKRTDKDLSKLNRCK